MRGLLFGLIGLAGLTAAGHAADIPLKAPPSAPAAPSWTGFYLGAGLGFRASDTKVDVTSAQTIFAAGTDDLFADIGCDSGLPCVRGEPFNGTAFRFAPYIGYNWQLGQTWVAGLEADFGFARQTTTLQGETYPAVPTFGGAPDSFAVKTSWDASARARVGYLVDPALLFYVTGGPAWLHIESTSNCSMAQFGSCAPDFGPSVITDASNRLGFTVGGGIEALLWSSWILRGEYRFSDYGTISNADTRTCTIACGAAFNEVLTYDVKVRTQIATLGLAYKFGDSGKAWASAAPPRLYAKAPAAVFSWSGFYVGAGAGVRATSTTATLEALTLVPQGNPPFNLFENCSNPKGGGCYFDDPLNGTSFHVGPYVGFNWQYDPHWVTGLEADFGFADQKTTLGGNETPGTNLMNVLPTANETFGVRTTWDASLRARLGYLVTPSLLIYGAAGPALMHIEQSSTCDTNIYFLNVPFGGPLLEAGACAPDLNTPAAITDASTRLGVTVGGGFEARLWSNWIARAEYQYADFGTLHFTDVRGCTGPGLTIVQPHSTTTFACNGTDIVSDSLRVRTHTVTLGLAYKFNTAGVAPMR